MNGRFISGSSLKIIAVTTMITDHIAAAVLGRLLLFRNALIRDVQISGVSVNDSLSDWLIAHTDLYGLYSIMRQIGRIAFPIYCFLLVEGFCHTKDLRRYIIRLGVFALLSEIPFDLAFQSIPFAFDYQNVFFTLFIGLITIALFHAAEEKKDIPLVLRTLLLFLTACFGMAWAHIFQTDYAARGVMCILVFYLFRKNKYLQILAGALSFVWWEPAALFAFVPLALYSGKRGLKLKYFFYLIYPVHLLLLYLICVGMGVASIPVV